jgi:predicted enzyme related to lactoylglutathione lyase
MGNPFVHMELSTGNVDAAKKFYKKVFDWKLEDTKGMPYTMIKTGAKDVGGGITKTHMEGQPTAWLVYAKVDSVKKTMAKAEKAGAKAVVAYMDIGAMGAIGIFADPTGGHFGVWEAAKKTAKKTGKKKSAKKPAKAGKKKK